MNKSAASITYIIWDAINLIGLSVLSLFLISFYFKAATINSGYPDWMVHAFRIRSIENFGLLSWTHTWSNGISLWKSYQFVPHFITLGVIKIFNLSITRGMILTTIGLFVMLRLLVYGCLRLLHFSPITSVVCSILSFDIAQYWGGVADFSLLFGFSFFPAILFLFAKYYQGKLQYVFPYIAGLCFYVHPILGYTSFGLWVTAILFSSRKIVSLSVFTQFIIFLISSSIFWFPIVVKTSYEYTNPLFANKYFLNLVLSAYAYYGLSIFLLICLFASFVRVFIPVKPELRFTKILFIFVFLYFILIIIGLNFDLPKAIAQLQFTRGAGLIGLGIIFVFAPVVESFKKISSNAVKGVLLFLLSVVVIESVWFTSIYSPLPGKDFSEPVSLFAKIYPNRNLSDARIWSSSIGLTSYYASINYRLPYSYMGHLESNQVSPRLSPLILYQPYVDNVPYANIVRLNDYFKITGVRYIFFDEGSPFVKTLTQSDKQIYKDLGVIKDKDNMYHVFEVPWKITNASAIDPKYAGSMGTFPFSLKLTEVNDQIALDDYVKKFEGIIDRPDNKTLSVVYPSQDSLAVQIPPSTISKLIYINESFDSGWKGYFNGKPVLLKPTGPNFTLAVLTSVNKGGLLFLKHYWPLSFYVSWYLILLIPCEIMLIKILNSIFFVEKEHYETH